MAVSLSIKNTANGNLWIKTRRTSFSSCLAPLIGIFDIRLCFGADQNLPDHGFEILFLTVSQESPAFLSIEYSASRFSISTLPEDIASRVEWKTNDGGDIKARDLIALAWIPLATLDLDYIPKIPPQNIYRNKGECAKLFDELMSHEDVSEPTDGEYTRKVHNKVICSALTLTGQLPTLYDKIYTDFPSAYNENSGKFGNISVVKMAGNMRSQPTTYFTDEPVDYSYPDGLILPLVYGLRALMVIKDDGRVVWSQDPHKFLDHHLSNIVRKYRVILDAYRFDPQKVGKNEGSYDLVLDAYSTEIMLQAKR